VRYNVYRLRWDRILVILALLMLPLIFGWLGKNLDLGGFGNLPFIGSVASHYWEVKALILLGIVLLGIVLLVKTLLRG
jgi:hypothetical protein